MKKLSILICVAFLLSACATFKSLDLNQVTFGMTTEEVIQVAGKPNRVLSARQTAEGYQEVLEFRTGYGEIYALEFWNDYLTGYEYLQDDVVYVAPVNPPMYFPQYGRPVYIINNRPNRPNRYAQPSRPSEPGRHDSGGSTPTNRPSQTGRSSQNDRPANSNRPGQPSPTSKREQSQTPDRSTMARPAEVPSRSQKSGSSTRESSRSTREESSSSRTQ